MWDYSQVFGHLRGKFVTLERTRDEIDASIATRIAIGKVAYIIEREACENLVEDHFHPEIAGPLQQALYFLQCLLEIYSHPEPREGGER